MGSAAGTAGLTCFDPNLMAFDLSRSDGIPKVGALMNRRERTVRDFDVIQGILFAAAVGILFWSLLVLSFLAQR